MSYIPPRDSNGVCPFLKKYMSAKKQGYINCEGVVKGAITELRFENKKDMMEHRHTYCNLAYEACPIAQMLLYRYERDWIDG